MDRYDIVVQSIDPGADPARAVSALVEALSLAPDEAASVLAALPRTVAYDRDEASADRALHALRAHGLGVRLVRPAIWSMPPDPPPPRASLPELAEDEPRYVLPKVPSAPAQPPPPRDAPRASFVDPPSSRGGDDALVQPVVLLPDARDALPLGELDAHPTPAPPMATARARAAPRPMPAFAAAAKAALGEAWSGAAGPWILQSLGIALLGGLLHVGAGAAAFAGGGMRAAILALVPDLATSAIALGFAAAWFGAAFRAGLGEGGLERPDRLSDALLAYLRAGAVLLALAGGVAAIAASGWLLANPWALALRPEDALQHLGGLARHVAIVLALAVLHAPIGLALVAMRGRPLAYVDPVALWRLMRGAPLELTCACGAWATASLLAAVWIAGWRGALSDPAWWQLALALLPASIVLQLGWSAAGALMGALVRSKPAVRA